MTDDSALPRVDPRLADADASASSAVPSHMSCGPAFSPPVARWFGERFAGPTEAQRRGWAAIGRGEDTLVMAPTGSGKTLAAFLAGVDALVRRGLVGELQDGVAIVYISPLKALGADVERNLQQPLRGIEAAAAALGTPLPTIRTALRTGDSTATERARIFRQPPHLLITTPESLYLLLTSERGRTILAGCEQVIVDEIHALVGNKRGAHLALSLERLDALCGRKLQRIGLSATVEPPAEAARFLVGHDLAGHARPDMSHRTYPDEHAPEDSPRARPCHLVDAGRRQPLDVAVEVPQETLSAVASRSAWDDLYARIEAYLGEHRTTLIFVPSRRLAERIAHDLEQRLGEGVVAAHHGALAKRTRQMVEHKLQTGALKAVVATASLELGIDVGDVELVVQVGSPRSISVLRQRIGRACHAVGGTPKGRVFATTRDDLIECAAAVRAMKAGRIDRPVQREAPLDILAQQLVATCAAEEWDVEALWALARRAAPYAALTRRDFDQVVAMLGDGIATRRGRAGALLHLDRIHGRARGRRGARLAALTSGGAIPDKADYTVVEDASEAVVGTVDEDFAIDSMVGDVFRLGSHAWKIRRVEAGRVRVEDARGQSPSIPFWNGEGLARSEALSLEVAGLRQELWGMLEGSDDDRARALLAGDCGLSQPAIDQAIAYVAEGARALGAVPTQECLVAERFFDEAGGMQLIIHAPFGARINRAFGMGLRKKFCRTFDFELQAAATDDAVLLSLGPQHSFPLDAIFHFLHEEAVDEALTQAALQSPMWETRWRWNVTRSLAVLRHQGGRRTPPPILRMRSADLLAAVFPAQAGCQDNHGGETIEPPDHPLVHETTRDCLYEAMDADGLKAMLRRLHGGQITAVSRDTVAPSPFSHGILAANPFAFLDDAPLEERWARQVKTARPGELALRGGDLLGLDPRAIEAVVAAVAIDGPSGPRDADELHDLLCAPRLLPARPEWAESFATLVRSGRAAQLWRPPSDVSGHMSPETLYIAAEVIPLARALWPAAAIEPAIALPPALAVAVDPEEAALRLVRAYVQTAPPRTAGALAAALGLGRADTEGALARLELDGIVLQGSFTARTTSEPEWCERRLLQRIHRLTLGRLREEVRAVAPAELVRFLARWQHVQAGTQLHGPEGLLRVIEQLEGLELPAQSWERDVLPRRVRDYDPAWLDELCLAGEVAWGRLSPLPAEGLEPGELPRGAGKVALFLREHASTLVAPSSVPARDWPHLSQLARDVAGVLERGAAFAADLRAALGAGHDDLEEALWELARAGAITSDGFAGLRALCETEGPRKGSRRLLRGRWSLLARDLSDKPDPFGDGSPVELARLYLRRYGVVTRPLLTRETGAPPWRTLLDVYRRLEARGEIRGGRFVAGQQGEQFALPEAVEALAALRRVPADAEDLEVAAVDPLNLVGIITPGPRVPAVRGQVLRYRDGAPVAVTRPLAGAGLAGHVH
ncbi:DEAD/DEAH box helicase [Nannocystis sp. SCPEA4]|uniref:DEAD/DEAH box helicase n=1 Tax=Nannocystis sp. SCPEA4 TaxID=2996787 RepID=UPI0022714BB7|nr:DEAD/DEAH box helicase [Nannocystis sp. SCPEA4]